MNTLKLNPNRRIEPVPEPTAADYAAGFAKAAISGTPGWGSPAAELFGMITAPILGRRREKWLEDLRQRINELNQKVERLTPEALMEDEAFISALAQATQAAMRTHQTEKRDAMRNGLLNVALGHAPSDDRQLIFLNLIDSFTPTHLQVLAYRNSQHRPAGPLGLSAELSDQAVRDLRDRGL